MSALLSTQATMPGLDGMDCRNLAAHQYAQWQEWAQGNRWQRSQQDLMEDIVDPVAERHMYIPSKQAALPPRSSFSSSSSSSASFSMDNEEMVEQVVLFFQELHNNFMLRQLQLAEGYPPHPALLPNQNQVHSARHNNDDTAQPDFALTELGLTPSLVAEQQELWNRAKLQKAAEPLIPDWLHAAAHQEGRRIRVVTVSTATRTVTCIGCSKQMLAAVNVEIVFCPQCGCTFAPDML